MEKVCGLFEESIGWVFSLFYWNHFEQTGIVAIRFMTWSGNSGWAGLMDKSVGPGGPYSTKETGWDSAMVSMMNGFFRQVGTVKPPSAERDMSASLRNATVNKVNNYL